MNNEVSIVLVGEAGQGIQTVENLLVRIFKRSGWHVFATKEYMSRVRGGCNSTSLRVAGHPVSAYVSRIDLLVRLGKETTKHLESRITKETKVFNVDNNTAAMGLLGGLLKIEPGLINELVRQRFAAKGEAVINDNLQAVRQGYELAKNQQLDLTLPSDRTVADQLVLSGAEAIALGAIAGGCDFIGAYPMTPSTGVFTYLSQHAQEFGIIAEQAEDEIAAINMALGAWYAGGRALVNTSGGGFDLMQEGVSLAGMLESPLVINLAQRPGPATGLPTRTEQGDLNLALHAGHGEFPRIILAPGNLAEAFYLTQQAFNLADKYQVPVFILSDQYLADSYYNLPPFDLSGLKNERAIVKSDENYQRYRLTDNGLSPRAIPGYGQGLVRLDSDEHDENGYITEDLELRTKMVTKRLRKGELLKEAAIGPELIGSPDYQTLVIGWGSNKEIVREALSRLNRHDLAYLHFPQVYPIPPQAIDHLKKAKEIIALENNATAQFAQLVRLATGLAVDKTILKFDGLPFSVEELEAKLG